MKATATYRICALAGLMFASGSGMHHIKENPPVSWADNANGDGGVDVTGAPKSRSVEGAGFGQSPSLSRVKWPSPAMALLSYLLVIVTIGGSNF